MTTAEDYKLELVQVLFRHGARTCSESEAKIPMPAYIDQNLHESLGYGQLTNIGKVQAYELGLALRQRYDNFLGPIYQPSNVYAYSSDYDRTKMTLQLVLAGLYPPRDQQRWNNDLDWMPVPFHYAPRELDVLLQSFEKPKYKKLLHDLLKSSVVKENVSQLLEFSKFFETKGIVAIKQFLFVACLGIFNVLNVHKTAGAKLPEWYTDNLMEKLKILVIEYFDLKSKTNEMIKLSIGPLIKRFIRNMNEIDVETTAKGNPRKIYLYSGHEMNIAPFTRGHGIRDFKYPDFANAVILEKFRDTKDKAYVRMLCWTGTGKFDTVKLGNFNEYCPINEYLKIVEDVVPTDQELEVIFNDSNVDLKEIFESDFAYRSKYKQ